MLQCGFVYEYDEWTIKKIDELLENDMKCGIVKKKIN